MQQCTLKGLWRIRMQLTGRIATQKEFEVREYVLPRFEVSIVAPEVITYQEIGDQSTQKITVTICAKYVYLSFIRWTCSKEK